MCRKVSNCLCLACVCACAASSGAFAQTIHVQSGSYGANCGARGGNVTRDLASRCNSLGTCRYPIAGRTARTRHRPCAADLVADWSCGAGVVHTATVRLAAKRGDTLVLTCVPSTGAGK